MRKHRFIYYGDTAICSECGKTWDTNSEPHNELCGDAEDPAHTPTNYALKHATVAVLAVVVLLVGMIVADAFMGNSCTTTMPTGSHQSCR